MDENNLTTYSLRKEKKIGGVNHNTIYTILKKDDFFPHRNTIIKLLIFFGSEYDSTFCGVRLKHIEHDT